MRHQTLIEIVSLVSKNLVTMTNQAYGNKQKFSYKVTWERGDKMIDDGRGNRTKDYYIFTLWLTDKNNSPTGKTIALYVNYYAVIPGMTVEALEEGAYREFLFNSMCQLVNVTYSQHLRAVETEVPKQKDIILSKIILENEDKPKDLILPQVPKLFK